MVCIFKIFCHSYFTLSSEFLKVIETGFSFVKCNFQFVLIGFVQRYTCDINSVEDGISKLMKHKIGLIIFECLMPSHPKIEISLFLYIDDEKTIVRSYSNIIDCLIMDFQGTHRLNKLISYIKRFICRIY